MVVHRLYVLEQHEESAGVGRCFRREDVERKNLQMQEARKHMSRALSHIRALGRCHLRERAVEGGNSATREGENELQELRDARPVPEDCGVAAQ